VWQESAPGLKSTEEATTIRHKILYAFEGAERLSGPVRHCRDKAQAYQSATTVTHA